MQVARIDHSTCTQNKTRGSTDGGRAAGGSEPAHASARLALRLVHVSSSSILRLAYVSTLITQYNRYMKGVTRENNSNDQKIYHNFAKI